MLSEVKMERGQRSYMGKEREQVSSEFGKWFKRRGKVGLNS